MRDKAMVEFFQFFKKYEFVENKKEHQHCFIAHLTSNSKKQVFSIFSYYIANMQFIDFFLLRRYYFLFEKGLVFGFFFCEN